MIAEFEQVGVGQWLRYATGALELVGAVLLVAPRRHFIGAVLLILVCIGAAVAQATRIHMDVIHAVVLAALLGWIAWRTRPGALA